jgi:hypothetical protein
MGSRRLASLILLGALVPLPGCGPLRKGGQGESRDGVSFERGAIILTGSALTDGPGTVLAAMSSKIPNFHVQRHSGQCPEISLRSNVSLQPGGEVNPLVYVDGTRTSDTCILEMLGTVDVERVEVYPQGFTTRPGYATHAHGLILVFMRSTGMP